MRNDGQLTVSVTPEMSLNRYLSQVRNFPMLSKNEEFMLAKRWQQHQDPKAAHQLVTSHLKLVAKIAMGYRGYGLPIDEVISEGNIGLMQAVKKFDPDKGFRLATYAMWWIKASIQEYILRSWSLVKMGTTAAQKKLFFNLKRLKNEVKAVDEGDLTPDQVKKIAKDLNVNESDVVMMNGRLHKDASLNSPVRADEGDSGEWQDWLEDKDAVDQEAWLAQKQDHALKMTLLETAMEELNEREKTIIRRRRLAEKPDTLETLAAKFDISRERIRQIEVRAFEKLQESMRLAAEDHGIHH